MLYDIWSEGFRTNGESGTATCHARGVEAGSFKDACANLSWLDEDFDRDYDPKRLTYWGCRLYPDEASARIAFG